tara:strand:- start:3418 stop:3915 length:498 start_codon:yes stop_codon:yes gene_type:complete
MNSTDIAEILSIELSLHKGGNFIFILNGTKIRFWISLYNGIEKLFVDEKLVSKKWSFRKNSEHPFTLNNTHYKVRIYTLHRAKYHFKTFLMKGDEVIIEQEVKEKTDEKGLIKKYPEYFLGAIIGALYGSNMISLEVTLLSTFLGLYLFLYWTTSRIEPVRPAIQ